MRELKFRQAIFKDGEFHHWHYWGFVGYRDSFVSPIDIHSMGSSTATTGYEVKESQQYIGLRCDPVSIGDRIYEGDKVQGYYTKAGYSKVYDVYYIRGAWEPFDGKCDSGHTDRYEVVGNIHQGTLKSHLVGSLKEEDIEDNK